MAGNERFDDSIGTWLQESAPDRLPQRVLAATFERTRRTRQDPDWRAILGRRQMPRIVPALGTAAAIVLAAVLAFNVGLISGPGSTPSPIPSASSKLTSGSMWPQSTFEEVEAAQQLADAGDPRYTWQLEDLEPHLGQGGPFREELYRRFLEEKLGWEDFHWTLGGGVYLDLPGVYFLRCAPSPADVFLDGAECEPTIDESRYETVHLNVAQPGRTGLTGIWVVTSWEIIKPYERPAPLEADVDKLLNDFVAARVAGDGAEAYLDDPEADVPLLYATLSGLRYESGGFGEVQSRYEWPYGLRGFMVWLEIDGLVAVNQLFFMPPDGRRRLEYVPDGFGTDIAPTMQDAQPVAAPYDAFDAEVRLRVAHPWVFRSSTTPIRLVPDDRSRAPTTDGGERNSWDRLVLLADPRRIGTGCPTGPVPANAEALAESIRSDPGLDVTAPVAVGARGAPGLMLDVRVAPGASVACWTLSGDGAARGVDSLSLATGGRMRLYLFDAPGGSSMRVLVVGFVVPEAEFERAAAAAASLSVEFSPK